MTAVWHSGGFNGKILKKQDNWKNHSFSSWKIIFSMHLLLYLNRQVWNTITLIIQSECNHYFGLCDKMLFSSVLCALCGRCQRQRKSTCENYKNWMCLYSSCLTFLSPRCLTALILVTALVHEDALPLRSRGCFSSQNSCWPEPCGATDWHVCHKSLHILLLWRWWWPSLSICWWCLCVIFPPTPCSSLPIFKCAFKLQLP